MNNQETIAVNDKDKRTGWLRGLKIGDPVIICSGRRDPVFTKIAKITPTGRMVTAAYGGCMFSHEGSMMGGSSYDITFLQEATPSRVETYNKQAKTAQRGKAIRLYYQQHDPKDLDHDKTAKIYEILFGGQNDKDQ